MLDLAGQLVDSRSVNDRLRQDAAEDAAVSRTVESHAASHAAGLVRFLQTGGNVKRATSFDGMLDYRHSDYLARTLANGDAGGALKYLRELTGLTVNGEDAHLKPEARCRRRLRRMQCFRPF